MCLLCSRAGRLARGLYAAGSPAPAFSQLRAACHAVLCQRCERGDLHSDIRSRNHPSRPQVDPRIESTILTCIELPEQRLHRIAEGAAIVPRQSIRRVLAPVFVDLRERPVQVQLHRLVYIAVLADDPQEELEAMSVMDLGAASAATLAQIARIEVARKMQVNVLAQPFPGAGCEITSRQRRAASRLRRYRRRVHGGVVAPEVATSAARHRRAVVLAARQRCLGPPVRRLGSAAVGVGQIHQFYVPP